MTGQTGDARQPAASPRRLFEVKVNRADTRFEVWLYPNGDPPELAGTIDAGLAADARHQGQDLVEELVEQALRQAERCHGLGARSVRYRHP
jgi:hypothetical protein